LRTKLFAAVAATCLLAGHSGAFAQSTPGMAAQPDFSAERYRAHVGFLADDLLEGRETGTRGHEIAAKYIATQFDLLGLKPGGENGGWFQTVTLAETALTGAKPTVTVTSAKGETKTYTHGVEVIVRGATGGGDTAVSAPAVFVGFGMTDKTLGVDDYKGLDVKGKIVVVLRGAPLGMEGEPGAHLLSEQTHNAALHGAVGLVSIQTLSSAKAQPWKFVAQSAESPRNTWVQKDGTPFDGLWGMKGSVTFDPAVAAGLFDGAPKTLDYVRAQDTAKSRPKGFPLKVNIALTATTKVRKYTSPEVIGVIEGSDPALKDQYVVLMGHADHLGIRPNRPGDNIYNGALDNAAGVATLLEVARAFKTTQQPRRSVLIIANTAEEKGLLGAEFWSHYPTVPEDKIVAGIDLDMPMLMYDFTDVVAYGADHSTLSENFKKAGAQMGVTLSPDPMPEQTIFVRSDHYALVKAGIPAVMLATGMQNGGQAAWDKYFANQYHQPSDDMSQPIVWASGAKFAKLNYLVARDLADADAKPSWYAGDFFGNLFAPNAPKVANPNKPAAKK
jgi:Peptidase family M28